MLAWQASVVLFGLSAAFVGAWLWELVRLQQHFAGGDYFSGGGAENGVIARIDISLSTLPFLWYGGAALALALGLRMAADLVAARLRAQQGAEPDSTLGPDTV